MKLASVEDTTASDMSFADKNRRLSEAYTTQGYKLLRHTDVLCGIQHKRVFRPIQLQLAPTEACESDCPFCSVGHRAVRSYIPAASINRCVQDFASLGAKSIEITGGGNPLLYRDRQSCADINTIIQMSAACGLEVGIITNSHNLSRITPNCFDLIKWIRISLAKLEEGKEPEDFNLCGFPENRVGFSYIYYSKNFLGRRGKRAYAGSNAGIAKKIIRLYERYPDMKFIRIAPDASIGSSAASELANDSAFHAAATLYARIFIQGIDNPNVHHVFDGGCYVGALRPYVASSPAGDGEADVYICSCHTHFCGNTYDKRFSLCKVSDVVPTWHKLSEKFSLSGYPYEVDDNAGRDWVKTCRSCCYGENNKLIHAVAHPVEDSNFA